RAAEWQHARVPLANLAETGTGERLEAIETRRGVRDPHAQRERAARRIERSNRAVEKRKPAVGGLEEREHETDSAREFLADGGFPGRHGIGAAGGQDAVVVNLEATGEGREDRRLPLVEPRQDRRVAAEKLERLVVQRQQAVTEERGLAIGENRQHDLVAR